MAVTLTDVARHASVSIKTVSRVVNNEDYVAEETRARVMNAIEELGYKPNVWAQRLKSNRSRNIALVIHDATPSYIMEVMRGLMDVGDEHGYHVNVIRTNMREPERRNALLRLASQNSVEGIVFTPPTDNSVEVFSALQDLAFPFVQITPLQRDRNVPWVAGTDEQGTYDATEHLLTLGHRHLAYIQGNPDHRASWDRRYGFERACADITIPEVWMRQGDWTFESGLVLARDILGAQETIPTAIACGNDEIAAGVLHAIYQIGLSCPDDISIVGFDDLPLASKVYPALTTVHQPIYEIATTAMTLLIEQIIPESDGNLQISIPTHLMIRKSTAPPRR